MAVASRFSDAVWTAWVEAARDPQDDSRREDLIAAIADLELGPSFAAGSEFLVDPIGDAVAHARYWQAPPREELVASTKRITEALRPIAEMIASSPAVSWWTSSVNLQQLRCTAWLDKSDSAAVQVEYADAKLARWRTQTLGDDRDAARNRPADPQANWSGQWWSTPAAVGLPTTTRPLSGLGSAELVWQEDSSGFRDALVYRTRPARPSRVWEIKEPDEWLQLVMRYPLDVTASRRHDWYRATGRVGEWRIPDWLAVARDWDCVHLSVAGYLTTAGRALALDDGGAATVLAGWNPDQAWWLTDSLSLEPDPEHWHRGGGTGFEDRWVRVD